MEAKNINEAKTKFAQMVEENNPVLSAIQSLAIGKALGEEEVQTIREFASLQEYLDLPMNAPGENQLKKLFVTAVVIAHQKGVKTLPEGYKLPEGYNNAESVASIVDEGLTRIKAAYQVAKGMINPIDAEVTVNDRLIVRTAAIVNVTIDKYVQKATEYVNKAEEKALSVSDKLVAMGLGRVSDFVCAAAVRAYPPAATIVPYVKQFTAFLTPVAQQAVKKGIKMAADVARNTIQKVAPKVKAFAKNVLAKLLG